MGRKAVTDNKKNVLIAKLAVKTGELYEKCLQLMQVENVKTLFGGDWVSLVTAKHLMYSALSQLRVSLDCKENKQIGEEIARLEIAQMKFNKCKDVSQADLKAAKKDNDFIYFEKVPPADELSEIVGALLVKSPPFSEKFLVEEANLFSAMPMFDPSAKKSECIIS